MYENYVRLCLNRVHTFFIYFLIKAPSAVILVILFAFSLGVVFIFINKASCEIYVCISRHLICCHGISTLLSICGRDDVPLFSLAHAYVLFFFFSPIQNCPHRVVREPSMIIPSGDTCQPTGVPQVLHLPPISVAGIN